MFLTITDSCRSKKIFKQNKLNYKRYFFNNKVIPVVNLYIGNPFSLAFYCQFGTKIYILLKEILALALE